MDFQIRTDRCMPTGLAAALTLGRHRRMASATRRVGDSARERGPLALGSVVVSGLGAGAGFSRRSAPRTSSWGCPRGSGGRWPPGIRVVVSSVVRGRVAAEAVCGLARRGSMPSFGWSAAARRLGVRHPGRSGGSHGPARARAGSVRSSGPTFRELPIAVPGPYHGVSSSLRVHRGQKPIIHINPTVPDRHLLRRMPTIRVLERPGREMLEEALLRGLSQAAAEEARASPDVQSFIRSHSWSAHAAVLGEALEAAERHVRRTRGG